MSSELTGLTDDQLKTLLHHCRELLSAVAQSLDDRPDMAGAIHRLMTSSDMPETFRELSEESAELSRHVLQAAIAALVNVQSLEAADAEMRRRAMAGN